MKYPHYFAPEIMTFMDRKLFPKHLVEEIQKELPSNFHELHKIGENESYICQLIRANNSEGFIKHVNRSNFPLKSHVNPSIYETNAFLIKKQKESNNSEGIALIKYATFFGSIQIIKYLQMQGVEMTPSQWIYAIHSQNAELIHFLEECRVKPVVMVGKKSRKVEENRYDECFSESIKCNHNGFVDYILNNYLQSSVQIPNDTIIQSLKYYNFAFLPKELADCYGFFLILCAYDYYSFVEDLLANKDIDINKRIIQNHIFFVVMCSSIT